MIPTRTTLSRRNRAILNFFATHEDILTKPIFNARAIRRGKENRGDSTEKR
jgi:hypothetical protein